MSHYDTRHFQQRIGAAAWKLATATFAASVMPVTLTHAQSETESANASTRYCSKRSGERSQARYR